MKREKRIVIPAGFILPTPNLAPEDGDSWARVELWRWQYGTLPQADDMRPLDVSKGLLGMAEALRRRDPENYPKPFNVAAVLEYAARVIQRHAGGPETGNPEPETGNPEGGGE